MTQTTARSRVLFVDDEPSILDALRDRLRGYRHEWDMVFAASGAAALRELERAPFQVVVSDMRMPEMDGADFLSQVKQRFPACARIVLSGHAEREAVIKALPVAHQFLNKPCDVEVLRAVVKRACGLQHVLENEQLREAVGKLHKLPSVPQTYWELTQAAARPDVTIAEIAAVVTRDPAMSVKVLQLVNSSYFGLARSLTSVQQAVAYLGIDLLKALALVVNAFGTEGGRLVRGMSLEIVQRHSVLTAKVAKEIVPDPKVQPDIGTAAMIHDIGKIVLALAMPEPYAHVVDTVLRDERSFAPVESEQLGVTHAEVGAFLLGAWGLPLSIVEAVAFHHRPSEVHSGDVRLLMAVHVGNALIDGLEQGSCGTPEGLDIEFIERLGLTHEVPRWTQIAQTVLEESKRGE